MKIKQLLQQCMLKNEQQKQRVCCLSYCLKSYVSQFLHQMLCVRFAAGRRTQDCNVTVQWRD